MDNDALPRTIRVDEETAKILVEARPAMARDALREWNEAKEKFPTLAGKIKVDLSMSDVVRIAISEWRNRRNAD